MKNKLSAKTTTFLQSHALSRLVGGLAALFAVFFMLFTPAFSAETFNIADYTKPEYGSGDGEKYFKWENTENGLQLTETDKANAQITAKYDTTQSHTHFKNTSDNSSMNITGGSFVNQSSAIQNYSIYPSTTPAKLGDIDADFIGNCALGDLTAHDSYAAGGAIYNSSGSETSEIGNITGNFIGNYASASHYIAAVVKGGAIYNGGSTIGDITGDFIGNYVSASVPASASASGGTSAKGGAIYNESSTIGNITGDFIGNYASTRYYASGGAIYNYYNSTIGDITGDFVGNYAVSNDSNASGGAISNYDNSTIGTITGDFIGNYAVSDSNSASGGAISNSRGTIGDITGDFVGNYISGGIAMGGAISNYGTIGDISGSFINNTAESPNSLALGGAIFSIASINIDRKSVV